MTAPGTDPSGPHAKIDDMAHDVAAGPRAFRFPADRDAPMQARRALEDALRDEPRIDLPSVMLCASEAVANAVVHAARDSDDITVELELLLEDAGLTVHVRDNGPGLTPRPDSPGLGLGLPLMAQLASSMEVQSPPGGGTEVFMHFAVQRD